MSASPKMEVRVQPDLLDAFREAARRQNMTVSAWVKAVLIHALPDHLYEAHIELIPVSRDGRIYRSDDGFDATISI